ncbi:unnamed protein product [Prorocentrum cordatum]|nr:unnamed protein product [Polarella glacialis]
MNPRLAFSPPIQRRRAAPRCHVWQRPAASTATGRLAAGPRRGRPCVVDGGAVASLASAAARRRPGPRARRRRTCLSMSPGAWARRRQLKWGSGAAYLLHKHVADSQHDACPRGPPRGPREANICSLVQANFVGQIRS